MLMHSAAMLMAATLAYPALAQSGAMATSGSRGTAGASVASATPASAAAASPKTAKTTTAVSGIGLEQIKLLALSVQEAQAVVSLPNQPMRVLKVGDLIPGTTAIIKDILPSKLLLEECNGEMRQMIWLHKTQGTAAGRIERFATGVEPEVQNSPPQLFTLERKGAKASGAAASGAAASAAASANSSAASSAPGP